MLSIALIGFGKWGPNYIRAVEDTNLGFVSTVVNSKSILRRQNAHFPFTAVDKSELTRDVQTIVYNLIANSIDAVIVATQPPITEQYAAEIVKHNIPIMCEKPYSLDLQHVLAMREALNKTRDRQIFLVNHLHLFSNAFSEIKKIYKSDKILEFDSNIGGIGPYREYPPLWDYGPHVLSQLMYLCPTTFKVIDYYSKKDQNGQFQCLTLEGTSGVYANIHAWNNQQRTHHVRIRGATNFSIYNDLDSANRLSVNCQRKAVDYIPPLTAAVTSFLNAIKNPKLAEDIRYGLEIAHNYTAVLTEVNPVNCL